MSGSCLLAAVVAFHPDEDFPNRARRILEQAGQLLVVDNSPEGALERRFPAFFAQPDVKLVWNANRGGLAGALNQALDQARAAAFRYLMVFDQDTEIPANYASGMLAVAAGRPDVAVLGPVYRNASTGAVGRIVLWERGRVRSAWLDVGPALKNAFFVINSGSLISLERVGPLRYREDFLVDFVDVDFCIRAREQGGGVAVTQSLVISHGIGNRRRGSWRFSPTYYPPRRKYLMTRNRLVCWREHGRRYPGFVANDLFYCILDLGRTILLEPGRVRNLAAMWRGLVDGLFKRPVRECYFPGQVR